jgi:hypothetical protein
VLALQLHNSNHAAPHHHSGGPKYGDGADSDDDTIATDYSCISSKTLPVQSQPPPVAPTPQSSSFTPREHSPRNNTDLDRNLRSRLNKRTDALAETQAAAYATAAVADGEEEAKKEVKQRKYLVSAGKFRIWDYFLLRASPDAIHWYALALCAGWRGKGERAEL